MKLCHFRFLGHVKPPTVALYFNFQIELKTIVLEFFDTPIKLQYCLANRISCLFHFNSRGGVPIPNIAIKSPPLYYPLFLGSLGTIIEAKTQNFFFPFKHEQLSFKITNHQHNYTILKNSYI